MFLYDCRHKKILKLDYLMRLVLPDGARRCARPHLVGRVLVGPQQLVDELGNHLEGGSVRGLQTPAPRHQLIPDRTKRL